MLDLIYTIFVFSVKIMVLYGFLSLFNLSKVIKIDNLIKESLYQDDQDFSKFTTKYKILTIFYLQNIIGTKDMINIKKNEDINFNKSLIKEQVKLAKKHGIYGFGIVYNITNGLKLNEEVLNLFSSENMDNFPFCILIYYNETYNIENPTILVNRIKKYLTSENYIKLRGQPILGIFSSSIEYLLITYFRKFETKDNKQIYIMTISNGNKNLDYVNNTNSIIEFPFNNIDLKSDFIQQYFYNFYYPDLIKEESIKSKSIRNFFIINGSSPEKFYIIFKKYLNLINPDKNAFILFNAWNNYEENCFLEQSEELGFTYLNYLSKAIFNLDNDVIYVLNDLHNKCKVAIQIHIFYEDLIMDIINKTNNIPVKFDLYITITSPEIKSRLENDIKIYSKTNYFEILIVENKGRDVLPFLKQIKTKFKYYKYLCHIHTKKSLTAPELGNLWRNYLYNNLLGNTNIVSEILYEFENNEKLGFMFPETYFGIIQQFYLLTEGTKNWMNFLATKLFSNYKVGELSNFPAGNMFWARIVAISQIFSYDFSKYFPEEDDQTNDTIMHAIERIWLYLVKFNDFYYKMIFKVF